MMRAFCSTNATRSAFARMVRSGVLALVLIGVVFMADASACPTCKDTLAANGTRVAEGFYWSILFMLAMPASIAAGWAIYLFRNLGQAGPGLESSVVVPHSVGPPSTH